MEQALANGSSREIQLKAAATQRHLLGATARREFDTWIYLEAVYTGDGDS